MSDRFDPEIGLVLVDVRIEGPVGEAYLVMALDTGATMTLINVERLVSIGFDPAASMDRSHVTTGSGVEYVARLPVEQISALGHTRSGFDVIAHTLPPSAGVDGLLGLDFLRGLRLSVDFVEGLIELTSS